MMYEKHYLCFVHDDKDWQKFLNGVRRYLVEGRQVTLRVAERPAVELTIYPADKNKAWEEEKSNASDT